MPAILPSTRAARRGSMRSVLGIGLAAAAALSASCRSTGTGFPEDIRSCTTISEESDALLAQLETNPDDREALCKSLDLNLEFVSVGCCNPDELDCDALQQNAEQQLAEFCGS